jgi:diguanylate cyclase (GGDEF)-like protein
MTRKLHRILLTVASLLWILFAGYAHFVTGPQYEFHLVFLLPVAAVCWFVGLTAGGLATLVSATVWMIADWPHTPDLHVLLLNEAVRLSVFLLVVVLVDRLSSALDRESALARVDPLTRLPNRRDFEERGNAEIVRARRYGRPLTLISLDLDNFKSVNDREGHEAGDRLLRTIAETLGENIRTMDVAARIGGDEFVVLLPETGHEAGGEIAAKLQQRLTEAMRSHGWPVTGSFGVATFAAPSESIHELLRRTDLLLYDAKQTGRDRISQDIIQT